MIETIHVRGKPRDAHRLLEAMVAIRAIEQALCRAALEGRFEGPLHVSLGEEAIACTGVDAELIDLCWLSPWDVDAVCTSVSKTSRLLIVHDAVEQAGFGAEIAARVGNEVFWTLDHPIVRVGARFSPVPVRRRDWQHVLPAVERVSGALTEVAGC